MQGKIGQRAKERIHNGMGPVLPGGVRQAGSELDDWDRIERDQLLHDLIKKIERICVGFDNHEQDIFNLVQALRTLFLYTHTEKESVDKFTRNFKILWDTVDAFGGSPGVHKGLANALLATPGRVGDPNNVTTAKLQATEEETIEVVKAALLINKADRRR